jgi:hypothetical protein
MRRSLAGGPVEVVEPLRVQYIVAMLSVASLVVRSWTSKHWAAASCWMRLPASSRSELVMSPPGLSNVTNRSRIFWGNLYRQRTGRRVVSRCRHLSPWLLRETTRARRGIAVSSGNHTPPAPRPEASWAPTSVGAVGTSSCNRVGREARSRRIHSKSVRESWNAFPSRRRLPSYDRRAAWRELNRPRVPGSARDIDRSSPNI